MFGTNKPAFGTTGTTSTFGASSSLFGQNKSVFGQPQQQTTSLFGQKPATTGLFGQSTPGTSGGLFGSSTANTTAPAGGGLFGSPQTKPSLFGASTSNTSFGQTSTSLFGSPTSATTGGTLFGATAAVPNGTTIKFDPLIGQDTMAKNGTNQNIQTKHMCITAMKQYEAKCLEELRVDDYMANRKAPTTTGGGLFGSSSTTAATGGLFGQTTQQKSIFGTPSTGTTFGAPSTSQATSIFGQSQPQAGTSLFGAKPAGTSLFGATSTAGSTFGTTTAPAAGGGLFGSSTTSAFGQPATSTGTSLFGQPAASQPSTGFSFGPPATSAAPAFGSTFGQAASAAGTTSLFGKPATTSAPFSFGSTTTTASPFGQPAAQQTTSLFGAKPATTFGQPAAAPSLFGAQPAQTGLFGAAQPAAATSFGMPAAAAPAMQQVAAAPIELVTNISQAQMEMALIKAQLAASPFGDSPLLKLIKSPLGSTEGTESEKDKAESNVQRQLRFIASKKDTASPLSLSKILDAPVGGSLRNPVVTRDLNYKSCVTPPTLGRGIRSNSTSTNTTLPAMRNSSLSASRRGPALKNGLDTSVEQALRGGSNKLLLGSSTKKNYKFLDPSMMDDIYSSKPRQEHDPDELPRLQRADGESNNVLSPLQRPADGAIAREATLRDRQPPQLNLDQTIDSVQLSPQQRETAAAAAAQKENTAALTPIRSQKGGEQTAPAGVTINSTDYFTTPPIDAMRDMVKDGVVVLTDGLTVTRRTFGSVFWPGRIELKDIVLDEIVVFRHKEVTVYPDESVKPPLGKGLNRPAEITLERVWPIDRKTKEEIKDSVALVNMGWREKLEKTTLRMDANFKDFRPNSGSWVFRVKHFSKYGMPDDDSDDETSEDMNTSMKENALQDKVQRAKVLLANGPPSATQPGTQQALTARQPGLQVNTRMGEGEDVEEMAEDEDEERLERAIYALGQRAGGLGGSPMGILKTSTVPPAGRPLVLSPNVMIDEDGMGVKRGYGVVHDDSLGERINMMDDSFGAVKRIKMETADIHDIYEESNRQLLMLDAWRHRPTVHRMELHERKPVRHFSSHLAANDENSLRKLANKTGLIDITSAMGTSSRVGWAAGGLSVCSLLPAKNAIQFTAQRFPDEYSTEYIMDMFDHNLALSVSITRQRSSSNRAKHCELDEESVAPRMKVTTDYAQLIHCFLATAEQSDRPREKLVWELCQCLFPADRPAPKNMSTPSWEWKRKEALGEWIKKSLCPLSDEPEVTGRGAKVWQRLCRGDLEGAIDQAISEGLTMLSCLLSVFTVEPQLTAGDFKQQISDWVRRKAVGFIPPALLKCYLTMAGLTHLEAGDVKVNCLEGLDWRRALGMRVWYSRWAETVGHCLQELEEEAKAGRVKLPVLETHLELIRVAVDRTRSIERLLDAAVEGAPSYNDYHLAWHLWAVTRSAGMVPPDPAAEQALHAAHAAQLTAAGLPHLALFVLGHINNAQCRCLAMREVLDGCSLRGSPVDYSERAVDVCKIPDEWIEWAKYLEAKMLGDEYGQCEHALLAGELELAHRLFYTQVAPDLLVCNELESLRRLCDQFDSMSYRILHWGREGQIYADYVELKVKLGEEDEPRGEDAEWERMSTLTEIIRDRLTVDERSTPLQQLAVTTMTREIMELQKRMGGELPNKAPLAAKNIADMVISEMDNVMMDY